MRRYVAIQVLRGVGLVLVLLVAGMHGQAVACSCFCDEWCQTLGDCCWWCPFGGATTGETAAPAQVTVSPLGDRAARIKVGGLQTMEMAGAFDCASALGDVPGVQRVTSVALVDQRTGKPVLPFVNEKVSGQSFEDLGTSLGRSGPDTKWLGFHTQMDTGIPAGIPAEFVIDVRLKPGVSFEKFVRDLRRHGKLGGGSALPDGSLDLHHYFLRDLKRFDFQIKIPRDKPNGH